MRSSPKFSLPHHLLTAGLFQEFLFCLYSTYLCALESTSLPYLLATLCWCQRDRENSVLNTMTINIRLAVLKIYTWTKGDNRSFSKFRSRCGENCLYAKIMTSSFCGYGNSDVKQTYFFDKFIQSSVNV